MVIPGEFRPKTLYTKKHYTLKHYTSKIYDSFLNRSILKICYCSKLNNFRNLMFCEIEKFGKFLIFQKMQIFGIFKIEIFLIFQITNFRKFPNWIFF